MNKYLDQLSQLDNQLRTQSRHADESDAFVSESLEALRRGGVYKALIPQELGGGGIGFRDLCQFLQSLAQACGSCALTLSMHQHLIAVQVWNYHQGKPVGDLLRKIAAEDLVLVSTGGGDWLASNGHATRVEGGYRVRCQKHFASGCQVGDLAVTSCVYQDTSGDEHVLHFSLPLSAEGVSIKPTWEAMGMRGTGSHSLIFDDVFVADERVALKRPRGAWHPIWEIVTTLAFPIFMAPYVGIAEHMRKIVLEMLQDQVVSPSTAATLGDMNNNLRTAQLAIESMENAVPDWDTTPDLQSSHNALTCKALIAQSVQAAGLCAMQAAGGRAYLRATNLERHYRDLLAAEYHPLTTARQKEASGRILLGGTPADLAS